MTDHLNELSAPQAVSRRDMLKAGLGAGGALFVAFGLPSLAMHFQSEPDGHALSVITKAEAATAPFVPNGFIRISADGRVTLTMPYVEMGQGTYTSIPMLIAEELEVDLGQVQLEHAPPNEKLYANPLLGVQATGNSNAIRGAWQPLRQAGATARTMLVAAAAERWKVDPATCRAQRGEVLHAADRPAFDLWRSCRRRGPYSCPRQGGAQGAEGFQADRHAGEAARPAGEDQRNGGLRHRRPSAGREVRDIGAIAGARRPRQAR